jgi:hypothetical protein
MTRKSIYNKPMQKVFAVKVPIELYEKIKSKYHPIELANLVRKYLEYLCIDKRTVQ